MTWEGPERRNIDERRAGRWHLKREVNLTHITATVAAVVSFGVWAATMDKRITIIEYATAQLVVDQRKQDEDRTTLRRDIREELRDINGKIDKLIQRR